MGIYQQQLMGVCQQLKVRCSQKCESRGVGACLAPDLCNWLCKCNLVSLGTDTAPVHLLNWLCKCSLASPGIDTAPDAGHGTEPCRAALCSGRHQR